MLLRDRAYTYLAFSVKGTPFYIADAVWITTFGLLLVGKWLDVPSIPGRAFLSLLILAAFAFFFTSEASVFILLLMRKFRDRYDALICIVYVVIVYSILSKQTMDW